MTEHLFQACYYEDVSEMNTCTYLKLIVYKSSERLAAF